MIAKINYVFLFILLLGQFSCDQPQNHLEINGDTTIYVNESEPLAVQKAAKDLSNDMEMVFGEKVNIVNELSECDGNTIIIAFNEKMPEGVVQPIGWERFLIQAIEEPFSGTSIKNAVVLTGSDMRGAIYSVYDFSEKFLGVDPLYWWTDNYPEQKNNLTIPLDLQVKSDSPTIKHRGIFINDEDLLSGWRSGTWFLSAIDPDIWDRLFEAVLRLKGNMIIPGTFIFPYEPQVEAAGERGLIITQHHVEVLGLNVYRWPDDIDYSFQSNKEKLISAWTKAVEQYPSDQEILWTVGYRGRHDRAFWEDEENSPASKQARADIIKEAITTQIDIVKEHRKNPQFIMNTWGEGIEFIREGYLDLPEEVTLVWADDGSGIIQDGGDISDGQGVYYHVAMFNHKSNQLTERVPVSRIQRELGRAVNSNATEYLLVNTSDFRPVTMSTQAALSLAWNASPWLENNTYHKEYLIGWFKNQFGQQAGEEVASIYRRYYETPAKFGPDETDRMGDNYYLRMARLYLRRMETGDQSTYMEKVDYDKSVEENAEILKNRTHKASKRWHALYEDAKKILKEVPDKRKEFYQAYVLTPIEIHLHGNEILNNVVNAFLKKDNHSKIKDLKRSIERIEKVLTSFEKSEYGKWEDFYQNDFMTGFRGARKCLELTIAKYEGRATHENISNYIPGWDLWDLVKAYQGDQKVAM